MTVKMAIVGMEAVFGPCHGLDNFDRSIYDATQHFMPNGEAPPGAYIKEFDIDVFHFKIPPNDLAKLDPQQLLMLKVTDNALKDAGLAQEEKTLKNVAVITAIRAESPVHEADSKSELRIAASNKPAPAIGNGKYLSHKENIVSSKIAALWNISGPAFTLCAEENSVFKALEIAQKLLTIGQVDAVVVGAVDLTGGLSHVLWRNQLASINTGESTLSYDCNANGWMVGEGAGAVVLKRHERAKQDQDRIYAVIDAVNLIQNSSATATESVRQSCQQAFDRAGVRSTDIGYLEVFGSGVEQQDEAEIQGLIQAYRVSNSELSCAIGSVKANIGHTYMASGIASLIKTALCLYHRYISATPRWSSPKKLEVWQDSPFYVATESRPWFLTEGLMKRVAAINSLALDGTYAHLILSEDLSQKDRSNKYLEQTPFYLFPIAANDQSGLLKQIDALQQTIENSSSLSTAASQTFATFQSYPQATYALAIVGHDKGELLQEIQRGRKGLPNAFAKGKDWKSPLGSYFTAKPLGKHGTVAFVYPGAFNSYIGMARKLFHLFPKIYDRSASFVSNPALFFREKLLYPRSLNQLSKKQLEALEAKLLADPLAMQVSGTGFAVLFTLIMRDYFRVQPQAAFGYSMGESSMLYALNVWTSGEDVSNFVHASPLFQTRLAGSKNAVRDYWGLPQAQNHEGETLWNSYVLMVPPSAVMPCLEQESQVYLTHINTPTEVVIAGNPRACLRVIETLNCESFRVPANQVLHCEPMVSEYDQLIKLNTSPVQNVPEINFYSIANYEQIPLDKESLAHNISRGFCQRLDFSRLINRVYEDGARIFIELGCGSTCSRWIAENLKQKEHITMSINRRGVDDHTAIVRVLAQLLSHRVSLDLSPLYCPLPETTTRKKSLVKTVTLEQCQPIPTSIVFDEADVLEFTEGQVSRVFGKEYEIIDDYARRVRLPSPPYFFVSRVTKLEGKRGDYKSGFIQTEYDLPKNAWYSVDGQVPVGIFKEAGHGLLLLLSYLGSDFESRGQRSFRLLDLSATFLNEQPEGAKTLRYDVKIDSYVKTTNSLIVFFSADCFLDDQLFMKLHGGGAGLFSDEELEQGQGIVVSPSEQKARSKILQKHFNPLLSCQKSVFDQSDLLHLSQGNIAACFGDNYQQNGLNPSLRLPLQKLMMIDRVISVDPKGGPAGLGLITGAKSVEPDDWYFLCHFKNDPTMPGSLMVEGSAQLLEFYLLFLGLQTCTLDARFQPIPHRPLIVRYRGQVTPASGTLVYQLEVIEIGLSPKPFAIANVNIIFGGKTIASFKNLGMQLSEKNKETLFGAPKLLQKQALFDEADIGELAKGDVANCLGPEYQIYENRRAVRLPNNDLCLVSRVIEVDGKQHDLKKISTVITEYDVPFKPWFLRQNSYPYLPYCTYIEIAGQPCIFLGVYLGTTLLFPDEDLYFRNLDGQGKILKNVDVRGKTITDKVRLLSSTAIKGAIIQTLDFQLFCDGEPFYQGDMVFGYFSHQVLANQVGLDGGKVVRPWYEQNKPSNLPAFSINLKAPVNQQKFYQAQPSKPHYHLAHGQLDFLDELLIVEAGGQNHQGYIYASKNISPTDWYFPCHFHQDPVMPGALGVEAILQAMQAYALQLDLGRQFKSPRFGQLLNHQITWKYRGQITPENRKMYLEVHISKIDVAPERVTVIGDASLWKDNMRIYEIKDVAICLLES